MPSCAKPGSSSVSSELSVLKAQINPYFFFNTLNNIYALTLLDGEQARAAIHRLSRMMRCVLYDTAPGPPPVPSGPAPAPPGPVLGASGPLPVPFGPAPVGPGAAGAAPGPACFTIT